MKIAIVTAYPPSKSSLNEYAHHFVRFLRKKSEVNEIYILTDDLPAGQTYPADSDLSETGALQIIPAWRFGDWRNPLRLLKVVRQLKPDVVFFNIHFASFADGKFAAAMGLSTPALVKAAGFTTAILLHNIMETVNLKNAGFGSNPILESAIRFSGNIITRLLLLVDMVAVTIPKYVEILREKYHAENVFLIPHGAFDDAVTIPSFDLPAGPLKIMTFGKFGTYKKVEMLIEAFKLLQTGNHPPLELIIAGSDSPNAAGYLDSVQQQYADVSGLHFTGYVAEEDIPRLFGESAVVIFPYTSTTGSSGVLHQAGSYAKAVVLPRLGDFAELIAEEGYTGEFFAPNSVPGLAQAIARIVDDSEHRREIGTRNFMASQGILMDEVVDWYLLHFETFLKPQNHTHSSLVLT
jgi:glycosyltransferase involved in cell wall biosynthesis